MLRSEPGLIALVRNHKLEYNCSRLSIVLASRETVSRVEFHLCSEFYISRFRYHVRVFPSSILWPRNSGSIHVAFPHTCPTRSTGHIHFNRPRQRLIDRSFCPHIPAASYTAYLPFSMTPEIEILSVTLFAP